MQGKLIASYRRELSALDDLQCAGTVTYTLTQEADAADPFPVRKRRGACADLRDTA